MFAAGSVGRSAADAAAGAFVAALTAPGPVDARRRKRRPEVATTPADPDAAKAERFDQAGKKLYARGQYADAVAAFEAGCQAKPLPRLLFNTGRCYEKLDDLPKAIAYFERYIALASDEADRQDAETTLGIAQVKLRKTRSEVRVTTTPSEALLRIESRSGPVDLGPIMGGAVEVTDPAARRMEATLRTAAAVIALDGRIVPGAGHVTGAFSSTLGASGPFDALQVDRAGQAWTCHPDLVGRGDGCDCGCGAPDADCGGGGCTMEGCTAAACDICYDADLAASGC